MKRLGFLEGLVFQSIATAVFMAVGVLTPTVMQMAISAVVYLATALIFLRKDDVQLVGISLKGKSSLDLKIKLHKDFPQGMAAAAIITAILMATGMITPTITELIYPTVVSTLIALLIWLFKNRTV